VLADLLAAEEVERPAGGDIPRYVQPGEATGGLRRMPRVPERDVGLEGAGAQIQRRQRYNASWAIVEPTMSPIDTLSCQ
jgi:hypothetical protein